MAVLRDDAIFLGASGQAEYLKLAYANRHGLVTGATGTGKTVTLQILAEGFSAAGVPVFCADIKGDLSGLAVAGEPNEKLLERAGKIGLGEDYRPAATPTVFWDIYGERGHPIRTTVSEMGPLLLARLMDLNDAQEGVLNICFRLADEQGLLLLDLKDLRAVLAHLSENASEVSARYGHVAKASVATVQRKLLVLEQQDGELLFGEPALAIGDLMRTTRDGRGLVSVLAADRLMQAPRLYSTFLLWLLSELFEELPEVGDPERPRLVFFFDEAHLLFDDAPKALLEKVEQVVRLIRSKGVGVWFVTQSPLDVPDAVAAQLGNRIQHALRAYTPREVKAVRAAAGTFRPNPAFDTMEAIGNLAIGEALVSTLEAKGVPSVVQRTLIRPPASRLGPIDEAERRAIQAASPVGPIYDREIDRESAFEILQGRVQQEVQTTDAPEAPAPEERESLVEQILGIGRPRGQRLSPQQRVAREVTRSVTRRVVGQVAADIGASVAGSMGRTVGRAIVRGLLGGILRG